MILLGIWTISKGWITLASLYSLSPFAERSSHHCTVGLQWMAGALPCWRRIARWEDAIRSLLRVPLQVLVRSEQLGLVAFKWHHAGGGDSSTRVCHLNRVTFDFILTSFCLRAHPTTSFSILPVNPPHLVCRAGQHCSGYVYEFVMVRMRRGG